MSQEARAWIEASDGPTQGSITTPELMLQWSPDSLVIRDRLRNTSALLDPSHPERLPAIALSRADAPLPRNWLSRLVQRPVRFSDALVVNLRARSPALKLYFIAFAPAPTLRHFPAAHAPQGHIVELPQLLGLLGALVEMGAPIAHFSSALVEAPALLPSPPSSHTHTPQSLVEQAAILDARWGDAPNVPVLTQDDIETRLGTLNFSHESALIEITLLHTSEGERILSASLDQTVRLWTLSGHETARLQLPGLRAMATNRSGTRVVLCTERELLSASIRKGHIAIEQRTPTLSHAVASPTAIALLNKKRIAIGRISGDVEIWEPTELSGMRCRYILGRMHEGSVLNLIPNRNTLVSLGSDGSLRTLLPDPGLPGPILAQHLSGDRLSAVTLEKTSQVITGDSRGHLALRALEATSQRPEPLGKLSEDLPIGGLALKDPHLAAIQGPFLHLFDCASGQTRTSHRAHNPLTALDIHRGHVLTGDRVGVIRVYDLDTGEQISREGSHQSLITHLAFDDESQLLVSTGNDNTARLWRIDGSEVTTLAVHAPQHAHVLDTQHLLTWGDTVELHTLPDNSPQTLSLPGEPLAFSGRWAAMGLSGGRNLGFYVLEGTAWAQLKRFEAPRDVERVGFSPAGSRALALTDDALFLYPLQGPNTTPTRLPVQAQDACFVGEHRVMVAKPGVLELHSVETGLLARVHLPSLGEPLRLQAAGHKAALVYAKGRASFYLWDLEREVPLSRIELSSASAVALAPNGHHLAAALPDRTIALWRL